MGGIFHHFPHEIRGRAVRVNDIFNLAFKGKLFAYYARFDKRHPDSCYQVQKWEGYSQFVYIGPSLPGGLLKKNAVLIGEFEQIKAYLAPVLEQYSCVLPDCVPRFLFSAQFIVKRDFPLNYRHFP